MSVLSSLRTALRVGVASLTLAALLVGGTAVAGPLARADYGPVTASTAVNIRTGPSTTYPKVGVLAKGETLIQRGAPVDGWVPVTYTTIKAWVLGTYVTGEQTSSEPISNTGTAGTARTTAGLNVRTGPALTYPIVATLAKGATVTTTGKISTTWTQIDLGGKLRWVSSVYLVTGSAPTTLPPIASYARATTDLLIRTTSGSDYVSLGEIVKGTVLPLTGKVTNGMAQIIWKDALRWVNNAYLTPVSSSSGVTPPPVPPTIGTRYATTLLNIRTTSGADSVTITAVPAGTALKITGVVENGRAQIVYNGAVRWVTALYLSTTAPKPTTSPTPEILTARAERIIAFAVAQLDKPYVYGAAGPDAYDCSGLTMSAYRSVGITLPRTSNQQYSVGTRLTLAQLQPGDLVFYYSPVSHVAIYVGNGRIIHAANPRSGILYASVTSMPFMGGGRIG